MPALDNLGRSDLQKLAINARKKLRNAELDKARLGTRIGAVLVGSGAAGAMGYVMGGLNRQGDEDKTLGTDEDPTKIAGIDIDLAAGLGITAIGVYLSAKGPKSRQVGEFVEAAGTGILSGYAYTWGHSMGMETEAA